MCLHVTYQGGEGTVEITLLCTSTYQPFEWQNNIDKIKLLFVYGEKAFSLIKYCIMEYQSGQYSFSVCLF